MTSLAVNGIVYAFMPKKLQQGLLLLITCAVLVPGCFSTQQLVTDKAASLFREVALSAGRQSDVVLVRSGIPAYLMLIDGMIQSYPDDPDLLLAGARAYASYASVLEEDESPRAAYLYGRGKEYAVRSLGLNPLFKDAMGKPLSTFQERLARARTSDVPALFWVGNIWGSWIAVADSAEAMADLPWVEALIERVLALEPSYYYGCPYLFKAILLSARPEQFGGSLQQADEQFKKAIAAGDGKFLMTYVYYAQYFARKTLNRELFESTLQKVLDTPATVEPDLTLANTLAQQKAKKLLDQADEFF